MLICELIEQLGGGTQVAAKITAETGEDIDREAIYKWPKQGVPWRWRPALMSIAKKSGIELPKDFLTASRAVAPEGNDHTNGNASESSEVRQTAERGQ